MVLPEITQAVLRENLSATLESFKDLLCECSQTLQQLWNLTSKYEYDEHWVNKVLNSHLGKSVEICWHYVNQPTLNNPYFSDINIIDESPFINCTNELDDAIHTAYMFWKSCLIYGPNEFYFTDIRYQEVSQVITQAYLKYGIDFGRKGFHANELYKNINGEKGDGLQSAKPSHNGKYKTKRRTEIKSHCYFSYGELAYIGHISISKIKKDLTKKNSKFENFQAHNIGYKEAAIPIKTTRKHVKSVAEKIDNDSNQEKNPLELFMMGKQIRGHSAVVPHHLATIYLSSLDTYRPTKFISPTIPDYSDSSKIYKAFNDFIVRKRPTAYKKAFSDFNEYLGCHPDYLKMMDNGEVKLSISGLSFINNYMRFFEKTTKPAGFYPIIELL